MMMMMMNCFCGMVDRRKAFGLISSRDHCQRSSPSRISDMPRVGFEPAQNLSPGAVEWSCAAAIITTPRRQKVMICWYDNILKRVPNGFLKVCEDLDNWVIQTFHAGTIGTFGDIWVAWYIFQNRSFQSWHYIVLTFHLPRRCTLQDWYHLRVQGSCHFLKLPSTATKYALSGLTFDINSRHW